MAAGPISLIVAGALGDEYTVEDVHEAARRAGTDDAAALDDKIRTYREMIAKSTSSSRKTTL